jgi:MFS family permease
MSHREVVQALSGLMLGMFVSILASTVVANALPRIIADLNGSQSVYTWIVTTELLAMTATVPLWGKMADLYSKKLLIQLSLGLFVAGSLIAGLTPNVEVLLVSRIIQGVGAGGMTALAMIVMAAMIPPGGVVVLALAVWAESKAKEPIIPLGIFRHRTVTLAIVASVLVGVAMFGGTVFLSQYFQVSLGKSPTVAGLMGLPMVFGLLISSTVAGGLITKFGKWKAYLVAGSIVMTIGMLLLSTIDAHTGVPVISVYMAILGIGVGLLMQNLVLAAQNDVPAAELGATTSALTFFRSMGGSIGVSALGAVLTHRVTTLFTEKFGATATGGGEVPDLETLPPQVLAVIKEIYGTATADLFLVGAPIAFLAVIAVVFIKEKPLSTLSGDERLKQESALH